MNYIFVDSKNEVNYIGIVEKGRLVEVYTERREEEYRLGNIYRARVENVVAGIDAAFLDIGHKKNAYLYVKDALPLEELYRKSNLGIDDIFNIGDNEIIQIIKEGKGDKGPKVTSHITIPGTYLVLTPYSNRINVSRKIDVLEAESLRNYGRRIQKDNVGFVIRTNANYVDRDEIEKEYNKLLQLYEKIMREKNFLPTPKLIYQERKLLYRLINKGAYRNYKVIVNEENGYKSLLELDKTLLFGLSERIILDLDFELETRGDLFKDLKRSLDREVSLEDGGSIIIDHTEAMTVIDVNSGSYTDGEDLNDTIWKINTSAAREIARQIRLRNISGIIIIDFIDFREKYLETEFLSYFRKELSQDEVQTNIVGITRLGLVEMTRKKERASDLGYFEDKYIKADRCKLNIDNR